MAALYNRRRMQREFRERRDLADFRDGEIISEYRLDRRLIGDVCDLVEDDVAPKTRRSHAIPCLTKVLVTLNFLARGDFYFNDGLTHGISKSSVCRSVWEVVASVDRHLNNINFPTTREAIVETKRKYFNIAGLPNCLGAVDGTLVQILAPRQNEESYVCRKGYHSINVQAVVGADMRFTDVVAKWPGATHDSTIFNNCGLKAWLEESGNGWLIGDSGYALHPYLMTPKNNPQSVQEVRYNNIHSRTRMVVERAFGLLKSRFRCLHKTGGALQVTPERAAKLFVVCAKLHNLCLDNNIVFNGNQVQPEGNNYNAPLMNNGNAENIRRHLIQRF